MKGEKARCAGCAHYVTKPYSPLQLLRTIPELSSARKDSDSSRPLHDPLSTVRHCEARFARPLSVRAAIRIQLLRSQIPVCSAPYPGHPVDG